MFSIVLPEEELFDDLTQTFGGLQEEVLLELEHSLVSLSKWESFFEKPFLTDEKKTEEETRAYIRFMCLTPNVPPETFERLKDADLTLVNAYITAKMTATWFGETKRKPGPPEIVTAELMYYWMIELKIPMECQHWHLNRLITLIEVCNRHNAPAKKTPKSDLLAERRRMNAERRKQSQSSG